MIKIKFSESPLKNLETPFDFVDATVDELFKIMMHLKNGYTQSKSVDVI